MISFDSPAFVAFILLMFSVGWVGVAALATTMVRGKLAYRTSAALVVALAMFPSIEDGGPVPGLVLINIAAAIFAAIVAVRQQAFRSVILSLVIAFVLMLIVVFMLDGEALRFLRFVQGLSATLALAALLIVWVRRAAVPAALTAAPLITVGTILDGSMFSLYITALIVAAAGFYQVCARVTPPSVER